MFPPERVYHHLAASCLFLVTWVRDPPMRELLEVHHIAVVVADLARSEQFYTEVLGLPVLRRLADAQGAPRSIWLGLKGAFLAVERAEAPLSPKRGDEAPGFHCVALGIQPSERESFRRRFAEAGIPIIRESAYTIYVRDPDGNLVGLSHHPVPVPAPVPVPVPDS